MQMADNRFFTMPINVIWLWNECKAFFLHHRSRMNKTRVMRLPILAQDECECFFFFFVIFI